MGSILSPSSSDNRSALREITRSHYETLVFPPGPRVTVEASDCREVSVAFVVSRDVNKRIDYATQLPLIHIKKCHLFPLLEYTFLDS